MLRATTHMSDRHERHVCDLLGMTLQPGSGNRSNRPLDGRHNSGEVHYAFGADCKSTLGKSLSVSLGDWQKLCDQAHDLRPMMPLRWYPDGDLRRVSRDLVVLDLNDFTEVWQAAEQYEALADS